MHRYAQSVDVLFIMNACLFRKNSATAQNVSNKICGHAVLYRDTLQRPAPDK
jgi:hypothetical protein